MSIENRKVFYEWNNSETPSCPLSTELSRVTITSLADQGKRVLAEGTLVFFDQLRNVCLITRWAAEGSFRGVFQWLVRDSEIPQHQLDCEVRYFIALKLTDVTKVARSNPRKDVRIVESSVSA